MLSIDSDAFLILLLKKYLRNFFLMFAKKLWNKKKLLEKITNFCVYFIYYWKSLVFYLNLLFIYFIENLEKRQSQWWFKSYHLFLFDLADSIIFYLFFVCFVGTWSPHSPPKIHLNFFFQRMERKYKTLFPTTSILLNTECGSEWVFSASVSFLI